MVRLTCSAVSAVVHHICNQDFRHLAGLLVGDGKLTYKEKAMLHDWLQTQPFWVAIIVGYVIGTGIVEIAGWFLHHLHIALSWVNERFDTD